jgi:fatty acid-binding protein DegV
MAKMKVVTDGAADVPADLADELGIEVVPLLLHAEEKVYRLGVDLTDEQAYELLSAGQARPQVDGPSSVLFEQLYRRLIGDYDHIFSIHLGPASAACTLARPRPGAVCPPRPRGSS